jgi:hypothetical protein
MSPTYDTNALRRLVERSEYERRLLEAIYRLNERELFPDTTDTVIYAIGAVQPRAIARLQARSGNGDRRPGFIDAGAPLIFVTTFKMLDMFFEWVLSENGLSTTFRFQEKIKQLGSSLVYPDFVRRRPWLNERLIALYRVLEPLRGTIIHDRHFNSTNGSVSVSSSKHNIVGAPVALDKTDLRTLSVVLISVLRYVDGTWTLNPYREKVLRHACDELTHLHGLAPLGQREPWNPTVRIYSTTPEPRIVDPQTIQADIARIYPQYDCTFDVQLLHIRERQVVDAFLFPWSVLENRNTNWYTGLNSENYRVPVPSDTDANCFGAS